MKLNLAAFALAFGIWWGAGVFVLTWWLVWSGAEPGSVSLLEGWYPGYALTPLGSVIGLAWGFACGTLCGGILAWLYNVLVARLGAEVAERKLT